MEMQRSPDDKKLFVLDGIGEMRVGGMMSSKATLTPATGGAEWTADRKGIKQRIEITDQAGGTPATYEAQGTFKRGGTLNVEGDGAYELRPSSRWKESYGLFRDDQELATIEASGWSTKKPVKVEVEQPVSDIVLLCACWLVKQFADDSAAATASVA